MANSDFDQICINTIRTLAIDGVQTAKSGHPGMPMGSAPMAYVVWTKFLRHNPSNPQWPNRDRFVLSAGHGSMLLYSLLHLTGYDLTLDDLKHFRTLGSRTPGHPEYHLTPGVETTTGPLGQGFANGVGMAIGQKFLASTFNKPGFDVVDYTIYGIVGDGDLSEGVASEAASLAGHLGLGNLVYLYDDNKISIDGSTSLSFTEDVGARFVAYGWHVQSVQDGNDIAEIEKAIRIAKETVDRPSLIKVRTHIGYGSPHKQDTAEAHGSPLGEEEVKLTKQNYGWDPEKKFFIPENVLKHFRCAVEAGKKREVQWNVLFDRYRHDFPDLARLLDDVRLGKFGNAWEKALPVFTAENGTMATREASGKVLAAIAPHLPTLLGGSADLTPSNNTLVKGFTDFQAGNCNGRYLRFGVREHAMGSIMNGIALTGGIIPYGGTFLVFSEYMRPPIRLAALMGIRPIYVFTHDSIGLGEDGPTHQPIEQLASLRTIPNLTVIRPGDANEVSQAWKFAINHTTGPVVLVLSRQKVAFIDRTKYAPAENLVKGAYILAENSPSPELILIATGSEVQLVTGAYEQLVAQKIHARVVSMPSWELFEQQPRAYQESIFPSNVKKRLAVEAGVPMGWAKYTGFEGAILGISKFGASAPVDAVMNAYGFTVENVVRTAKQLLGR